MNSLEVKEHVLRLEKELGRLRTTITRLENEEVKKWSPTYGKYILNHSGVTNAESFGINTNRSADYGSSFDNIKDAERAYKAFRLYHRLYKLAEELNEGWKPNWKDFSEVRYVIYYSHLTNSYKYNTVGFTDRPSSIIFKSRSSVEKVIEILERGDV